MIPVRPEPNSAIPTTNMPHNPPIASRAQLRTRGWPVRARGVGPQLAAVALAVTLGLPLLAGCQPQTGVSDRPLDGANLQLKWSYDVKAPINQTPLRAADVVAVVPSGGALTALDVQTGELRWQFSPGEGVWERSYASDGRRIYVGIGGGSLVALEAEDGAVVWKQDVGINVQLPPLVRGDRLYVPTTFVGPGLHNDHAAHAKLVVLDSASGTEQWSFETDNYILQTPAIDGEAIFLAGNYLGERPVEQGGHTRLYALRLSDGELLWSYESEDGFVKRLHAAGSTVAFTGYQDFVSGVDAAAGRLRWRHNAGNWVPSLTGNAESVFFGSANTIVHAIDLESGEVQWQHNIAGGTFNYVLGAPVLVEDELCFLSQHGDIMCLDANTGELRWEFPTGIVSRVGMELSAGWIFIGDQDGVVYGFSDR